MIEMSAHLHHRVSDHDRELYLRELEIRKKKGRSIVPTLKYSFFALASLFCLTLGLFGLPLWRRESLMMLIGLVCSVVFGLSNLCLWGTLACLRFRDWLWLSEQ